MAQAATALAFGLRQVVLSPYLAAGTVDSAHSVALAVAQTFNFTDQEDFQTLDGDDHTVASHGAGPTVAWELDAGGVTLAAWIILAGGTLTTSGSTPAGVTTFSKLNTDARPYFVAEGRAISDSGGDFHAKVFRCKADGDLEADLANGAFQITKAKGTGYGDPTSGQLYTFIQNETATPITVGS